MSRLLIRVVMVLAMADVMVAAPATSIAIDLSKGKLTQSNCQTAIGCGHSKVAVNAGTLISTATNRSPAQHILTLDVPVPRQQKEKGPHVLQLDYELSNPSGHAANAICAVVQERKGETARCARGVHATGTLQVPLDGVPDQISLRFGLMPFSANHLFKVQNVRVSKGGADAEKAEPAERRVPVRLSRGRLRQRGCATPIGCDHPTVTLTDDVFSSTVLPKQAPPPSDNPNEPPPQLKPPQRIELELPIADKRKGRRSLHFSYRLDSTNSERPGQIVLSAITGESVWQSKINVNGKGEATFELPAGAEPIDKMGVSFEPPAGGGASFDFSNASFAVGGSPAGDALPVEETTTCEGCDPPASRLDPCGAELLTFWVEAADGRRGRGIRCMSFDLTAWYGEGWWDDFDYGWYRHIGYVHQRASGLPSRSYAADLGVRLTSDEGTFSYGGDGLADLRMEWRSLDRVRVFTSSGSWNETWQLIPKGDLLPGFFGPRAWDYQCGDFGLMGFDGTSHHRQSRCAIPLDLIMHPAYEHAATPLVWLGEGRIEEEAVGSEITGLHLGWQLLPPAPGAAGFYAASDVCPAEHPAGCRTIDTVTMEIVGPDPPADTLSPQYAWWITAISPGQGLYVFGPGTWQFVDRSHPEVPPYGLAWVRKPPELGSLATPTPICLDADCP